MTADALVAGVRSRLGRAGPGEAAGVLRAVLRALGDHLPPGEAALLAAALPADIAPEVRHPGPPSSWDGRRVRGPLVTDVAARLGTDEAAARGRLDAVLDALADAVPPGVLYRAEVALPGGWPASSRSRAS